LKVNIIISIVVGARLLGATSKSQEQNPKIAGTTVSIELLQKTAFLFRL